jgi:hypothetical protein
LAVKSTFVPAHIGPAGKATIFTVGTTVGITVKKILLDVIFDGDTQIALDVKLQVTKSPLLRVADEKVLEFPPTLIPFICH